MLHRKNTDQQQRGAIQGEKLLLPWWANFPSTGQQAHYSVSKITRPHSAALLLYRSVPVHCRENKWKAEGRGMLDVVRFQILTATNTKMSVLREI
jgi:hypothetical protein